jgi:hypothetical protein
MSVTLSDVIKEAGYDWKNDKDDAIWITSQLREWEDIYDEALDYLDYLEEQEGYND